jgi:cytochrome P450
VAASEWALTEILRNPHILEKAQAELDDVLGKSRRLRESDIPKLKYIQAMVKEAFRLHPAPMPPPHESMQPCKAFGYDIPAKTGLLCNFYAIQRDAAVWHKPLEFDPSRFLEGSPTASISMNGQRSFDLIPFGSGRRSCPAIEMGTILVTLITANLLYAFEWSVPDRRELEDDTEDVDHTASRAVALTAIVKRRLPSELYT